MRGRMTDNELMETTATLTLSPTFDVIDSRTGETLEAAVTLSAARHAVDWFSRNLRPVHYTDSVSR
jgi:hypothetical protein